MTLIEVDPPTPAPRPRRSAVERERFANDKIRGIKLVEQRQGIAEHREHGGVTGKRARLLHQFDAPRPVLLRGGREMINRALTMRPGGQCGRQRVTRVPVHRLLDQFEGAGVALCVE